MSKESKTSCAIYVSDWKRLNILKNPKDSFADVIRKILDERESKK